MISKTFLRKHAYSIANIIIIILILIVYVSVKMGEMAFFKEMAASQAENDVKLTAMDINSDISGTVNDQIIMSRILSDDKFIKEWARNEPTITVGQDAAELYNYLSQYRLEYGYNCVFFISDKTKNYYSDKGFNKTLDLNSENDRWYNNFLDKRLRFDTQVDLDELNDNNATLFVNCIIQDKGFKTLGIVGVAKSLDSYQNSLPKVEEDYNVKICLVDINPSQNAYKGSYRYYCKPEVAAKKMDLTEEQVGTKVDVGIPITFFNENICTCIVYNSTLGWNVIVQRDIGPAIDVILKQTYRRSAIVFLFILVYMVMSFRILANMSQMSREAENTDELTGLYNNKLFKEIYQKKLKKNIGKNEPPALFMIDIDNFKIFNDTYGHLYGNSIIKIVADGLKQAVKDRGMAARWGGDEFIGVIRASEDESKEIVEALMGELKKAETQRTVTLSCGLVKVNPQLSFEKNMEKADEALYFSKSNGKGIVTVYKDIK